MTVSDDREPRLSERIREVAREFPGNLTGRLFELVGDAPIRYFQVVSPSHDRVEMVVYTDTAVLAQQVNLQCIAGDRHAQTAIDVWARRDLVSLAVNESQRVENRAQTESGELLRGGHPGVSLQYLNRPQFDLRTDLRNSADALREFLPSLVDDLQSPTHGAAANAP